MCRVSTDLASGDPLPGGDEVARYCSPIHVYDDLPAATAFVRQEGHRDLSVNRLQSFVEQDRSEAVDCIRSEVNRCLTLKPKGRFVVVNVGRAKGAAQTEGCILGIIYTPEQGRPSHSSIVGLPEDHREEVRVATALMRLVAHEDVYPALTN